MPSSEDRARVIANNRSLRIIKNELDALVERDFLTDEQYDQILHALPAEASLHNVTAPNPSRSSATPSSITESLSSMSVKEGPPSTATTPGTQPPSYVATPSALPQQQPTNVPMHHEVAHVVALYHYNDPDPRDLKFEAGDHISVMEYCNAEWGNGKNVRTGDEGIFPRNYVRIENYPSPLASAPGGGVGGYFGGSQKHPMGPGFQQQQQQGYMPPPAPGPSSPYDGAVPPMQIANQPTEHQPGKGVEMGKKFGRKLGNAAIFGAGMTLGGDLVNSIF